ncbi:hypothetical protein [Sphingomonas sp. SUN039]|uniref:hypothetical protein n=1 Tax=Sphingomonas sp. SUN039 TaxID=2937787 RepID=UPI0021642F65|nr:hypothetical protein [Sphingomonas sp. SUN039]UVO53069.1 hypothetical protein M0209_02640 [Sphingomonas sp. SUN039]
MNAFWERLDAVASQAKQHYAKLEATIEPLHFGEWVSIDAESGAYVFGGTRREACENFEARFGATTPSWTTQVGMPASVGFADGSL